MMMVVVVMVVVMVMVVVVVVVGRKSQYGDRKRMPFFLLKLNVHVQAQVFFDSAECEYIMSSPVYTQGL